MLRHQGVNLMGIRWVQCAAFCVALAAGAGAEARQRLLVVNQAEGVVTVLDPTGGEVLSTIRVGLGPHEIAVSPDGRMAVVSNYGLEQSGDSLSVIDTENQRLLRNIPLILEEHRPDLGLVTRTFHRPSGLTFTRDGERVLVTSEDEQVLLLVDISAGRVLAAIETEQTLSGQVLLDRDGKRAFVANSGSGSISVIDLGRRRLIRNLETGGGSQGMALHPSKDELWVANSETNSISVIDTQTLAELAEFPCATDPVRLAFMPDGSALLCVNRQEGSVSVFETENHRLLHEIRLRKREVNVDEDPVAVSQPSDLRRSCEPTSIQLAPGGLTAWVTCSRSGLLAELDLRAFTVRRYLETGSEIPLTVAWSGFEDDVKRAK